MRPDDPYGRAFAYGATVTVPVLLTPESVAVTVTVVLDVAPEAMAVMLALVEPAEPRSSMIL